MKREEAIALIREHVKKKNLVKHMIATGACMKEIARVLGEDEDRWELAGILHDLDYEVTYDKPEEHAKVTVKMLEEMGFNDREILDAILAHAGKKERVTPMEKAIYAIDPTTGFIVACALMHPSKSLAGLDLSFMLRRFKEKRFAEGANREQIKSIEELGISLEEFLELCLKAMRSVSKELGL